jgi:hypothetical protein
MFNVWIYSTKNVQMVKYDSYCSQAQQFCDVGMQHAKLFLLRYNTRGE